MTNESSNNMPSESPQSQTPVEWRAHFNISMRAGLYIGLAFALNAFSWLFYSIPILQGLLGLTGFILAPVLVIMTAIKYRDQELGGHITYLRSVSFMTWSYLFAVIISTVAFYTVFSFLFKDTNFINMLDQFVSSFLEMSKDMSNQAELEEAIQSISPRTIAFNIATTQLFLGLIFMYIAALFVRR